MFLFNNFPYLFHNLLVRNRHYCNDVSKYKFQDRCYKDELESRGMKSAYTFLIKDPIKETPIGFISLEYNIVEGLILMMKNIFGKNKILLLIF